MATAEEMDLLEGLRTRIASVGSLIALKVLARDDLQRPQDRVDLVVLLRVATTADVDVARHLLGLIDEHGYARGRDLLRDLETLSDELRP